MFLLTPLFAWDGMELAEAEKEQGKYDIIFQSLYLWHHLKTIKDKSGL